jgi:hypothetical protein
LLRGLPGIFAVKSRSKYNPSGTKAKQCALKIPAGRVDYEVSSEMVKHRAECRAQNETFALVSWFLQDHTSINRVSAGFLVAK